MSSSNKNAMFYVFFIAISGVSLLAALTIRYGVPDLQGVIFMSALCIIAESLSVPLSADRAVSVGFAVTLASMLSFGPVSAAWVTAFGTLLKVTYFKKLGYIHLFNVPFYKTLFNVSNYTIACMAAGGVYILAGGEFVKPDTASSINGMLQYLGAAIIPLLLLVLTFLLVNSGILAILFGIMSGQGVLAQWSRSFKWAVPNEFAIASIGIIITVAYNLYGPLAVILFFGPLILARYAFKLYIDMSNVYFETIKALTAAIEAKDKYTEGHSRRVEKYVNLIAREMNLSSSRVEILRYAALLHDIGKIGISEQILNKPSKLSEDEYDTIKQHPVIGYKILEDVDFLKKTKDIIKCHHEYYNGNGYPGHLSGKDIPLESLIMSVADAFDAMTTDRPYRKAMSYEKALEIIRSESGKQFSPEVVRAFERAFNKHREAFIDVV